MRATRNALILASIFFAASALLTQSASAQMTGGTPGSGDIPSPPAHATYQVPTKSTTDASSVTISPSLAINTALRVALSRWLAIPLAAPGTLSRRLVVTS